MSREKVFVPTPVSRARVAVTGAGRRVGAARLGASRLFAAILPLAQGRH